MAEAEPEAPAVDVVRIMKEIRESIQDKRAQGIYTDEEVESLAALRLRAYAEERAHRRQAARAAARPEPRLEHRHRLPDPHHAHRPRRARC